jgi:hypothetical protein
MITQPAPGLRREPALHVVARTADDPAREQGGQVLAPYGDKIFAKLTDGPYWVLVKGWVIRPQRFGWRKPQRDEKERTLDWRVFLHGPVVAVPTDHPNAPTARSEVFQWRLQHDEEPWVPIVLRFAVTETTKVRIVPPGGQLWELLAITGHRNQQLTADVLDTLIGWTLKVDTRVTKFHRGRGGKRRGAPVPAALQHSFGGAVSDAKPPSAQP